MNAKRKARGNVASKLIAALLVTVFLALGLIGLILPIIPGLLFLALAAVLVARHVPPVDAWLRKNRKLGRYLDRADGFFALGFWHKAQLCGLICLKGVLDAAGFLAAAVRQWPLFTRFRSGRRAL